MKFEYKSFSCDVDVFYRGNDVLIRFYDSSKEHDEDDIRDLVIVDPGYGYLVLKSKGDAALLSGFLEETVFSSDELVDEAINFLQGLSPVSGDIYTPYHVDRVKLTSYVEYNGEY